MEIIIEIPELKKLRGWMLKTKDAHGLYNKFGFDIPKYPDRILEYSPLEYGYKSKGAIE